MTIEHALAVLRGTYSELLDDLARGERVLWIGAGISRDQVPEVEALLKRVLSFLRDKIASGVADDVHLEALDSIISEHLPDELDRFRQGPTGWDVPEDLSALVTSYSRILGTDVGTEDQDYLLWEAVDVRETYGSPDIEPGPEHWLIAFLCHEGVVQEAVTTNWDGLIERAVGDSSIDPVPEKVSVLMSQESFRDGRARFKLYKAHGCAVLARGDEANRKYLVAQSFDINTWRDNPIFTSLVDKLRELAKNRESLMLGTSFQDSNLLGRIASATQDLVWPWKPDDPACVFAEPVIAETHKDALKLVYRNEYATNRTEICALSAAGMFSGVLLAAATLHVVMEKFKIGLGYAPSFAGSSAVVEHLEEGIGAIENILASDADTSLGRLIELLRSGVSSLVQRFFEPAISLSENHYKAIYDQPIKVGADAQFRHLGVPELSVTLGLLGLGIARGYWSLILGTGDRITRGVFELNPLHVPDRMPSKLLITRDWSETDALKSTDLWVTDPGDLLIVQARGDRPNTATRGPVGGLGSSRRRSSKGTRRVTWLSELASHSGDTDALLDTFRAEVSA